MLATYLNKLKSERNLKLREISERSGVPVGTVGRIFSGEAKNPGYDNVVAIVRALGGDLNAAAEIMVAGADAPAPPAAALPKSAAVVAELAETFDALARHKDEQHLSAIDSIERTHQADVERLARVYEQDLRRQQRIIVILVAALGVVALAVFALLFVDILHPSIGWIRVEWP